MRMTVEEVSRYMAKVKPGAKLQRFNSPDVYHVRAVVDGMLVLRKWSRISARHYWSIEHPSILEVGVFSPYKRPTKKKA